MRVWKISILIINLLFLILISSGCWNYIEINDKAIVAGVALDPGTEKKLLLTVEIVNPISKGKEAEMKSVVIGMEGDSIFDATRNIISKVGKKLYWGHTQVLIINEGLAREGVRPILDLAYRDPEIRLDVALLISREKTAKEVFAGNGELKKIRSFQYGDIMGASGNFSKIYPTELWHFLTFLFFEGTEPVVPGIRFTKNSEKKEIEIFESALFKGDRLIGWVPANQNKYLLIAWNVYESGVIVIKNVLDSSKEVTLEILECSTYVKPVQTDTGLQMNIDIKFIGAIGEISGGMDVIKEEKQKRLEKEAEKCIAFDMTDFIKDMQKQYDADIFDFGLTVKRQMPDLWKQIHDNWSEIYPNLAVQVNVDLKIVNSGLVLKPIKVGD